MSDTRPDSKTSKRRGKAAEAAAMPDGLAVPEGDRIAKVMARAGLCSRRDAEAWIKEGRVAVNGKTLTSPALNIGPDDAITVDGQPVSARERTRLFLYHKPRGLVTTARDPEGRPTVFDALPDDLPRVVSVGRLDINTEGLLLLTNDGGLARVLELPATGWLRRYRVRANGFVAPEKLEALKDGITIDGVDYAGIEAALDRTQGANQWLTMGLREGKNREIKRVLEHLGLFVNRLIRLSFGPFQLGDLAEGAVEEVRTRVLQDQLGEALAAEAGVMWEDAVAAEIVTRHVAKSDAKPAGRSGARTEERGTRSRDGERAGRDAAPRARTRTGERSADDRAERPRQDRPAPKSRPHVSALRGDGTASAGSEGPRKRITRATTEDRRGRSVKVERVTVESRDRVKSGEGGTSRNARNFARARREAEFGPEDAPARKAGPNRSRTGERAGGFSSERPLTGRALKDGKVRTSPSRMARPLTMFSVIGR
ncbi:MAG: pseudouridine synthase, partial [Caulobacteraceae bacterium]|nr:pseudouridine synthase [Caulobacter sp.]